MKECSECCVKHKVSCPVQDCRYWIDYEKDLNCSFVAIEKQNEMTLFEVAARLGVSSVRIKQIQDNAMKKCKKKGYSF